MMARFGEYVSNVLEKIFDKMFGYKEIETINTVQTYRGDRLISEFPKSMLMPIKNPDSRMWV